MKSTVTFSAQPSPQEPACGAVPTSAAIENSAPANTGCGKAQRRLFAYPLDGIAYNECLYGALAAAGICAIAGRWSVRWLHEHVHRGDMLHIHWPSFYYYEATSRYRTGIGLLRFFTFLFLARLKGVRIFWTAHNLYPHDGGRSLWAHRVARRFVVALAERIFVHGATACELIQQEFTRSAGKLVAIQHGHWIDYYPQVANRAAARAALGLREDAFVYGFVGSCKPYKGLEELLTAFAQQSGNCMLLIAGHFQSKAYLESIREQVAALPADKVVLIPRFLDNSELPAHITAIDVLVLPFREILTSGSLILGLSFGTPVIAPKLGAVIDVMNDSCGLLYDPTRPDALMLAMQRIRAVTFNPDQIIEHARTLDWSSAVGALVQAAMEGEHSLRLPSGGR